MRPPDPREGRSRPGAAQAALKVHGKDYPKNNSADSIDVALAAIGIGIECREIVRRLNGLLDGAP